MSLIEQVKTKMDKIDIDLFSEMFPIDVFNKLKKMSDVNQAKLIGRYFGYRHAPIVSAEEWLDHFDEDVIQALRR